MSEYDHEPVPGLPERLPAGEHILWQGAPDWRTLARTAFHAPMAAVYFAALILWGLANGSVVGAVVTLVAALLCIGLLCTLAWISARTTIYTITNRRVVMRFGMALPKCVNLPLKLIANADLKLHRGDTGDIALALADRHNLGWLKLWPHARPWRVGAPEPMLRAIPSATDIATLLGRALAAALPEGRRSAIVADEREPAFAPVGQSVAA